MEIVVVLAGSYLEGRRFTAAAGLRGATVIASGPGALGLKPNVILELPNFTSHPARHAINAHMKASEHSRYRPSIRMLLDEETVAEIMTGAKVAAAEDELSGQTTIDEQIALAELEVPRPTPVDATQATRVTPQPAFKPRSRAKVKR